MKTKEKYLEQSEIKVKNLLSELFESESETQNEMMKTKEKLNQKIAELETKYSEISKKRKELQEKFEQLKSVSDNQWENAQNDFDLLLKYVEGEKETFIHKAEEMIDAMGKKIQETENEVIDAAKDVKVELTQKVNDLKTYRQELQEKINAIKNDTGERWREIKHWFIEKSKSVKEYLVSH